MFRSLFAFTIGLFLLAVTFAAVAQTPKNRTAKVSPARVSFEVKEIDTAALKGLLTESKQRALLVNFWATWCDSCRDEFPDLVKVDSDYRPRALDFVTISLDDFKDINTEVPRFLQQMNATMPAYLLNVADPEPAINAVDTAWQGDLPATFLYNAKGELVFKHFGRVNINELRAAIDKLIDAK